MSTMAARWLKRIKTIAPTARLEPSADIEVEDESIWISERVHLQVGCDPEHGPYANLVREDDGGTFCFEDVSDVASVKRILEEWSVL